MIPEDAVCPKCGYRICGLSENRCPECGNTFNLEQIVVSSVPWSHRQYVGRVMAYLKTVWLVTVTPQVRAGLWRPVSWSDAQRFRFVTIALATGSLLLSIGLHDRLQRIMMLDVLDAISTASAIGIALMIATGLPSYFFESSRNPIEQRNRTIALSYYAGAPLALMPLILVFGWISDQSSAGSGALAAFCCIVVIIIWWAACLTKLATASDASIARRMAVALLAPMLSVLAAVVVGYAVMQVLEFFSRFFMDLSELWSGSSAA